MSKHPAPTREHHDGACLTEKWDLVRGATGKPVTHHRTYELTLYDGRILRTRISRPVNRTAYSKKMWQHILTQQLEVTGEEFWDCVLRSVLPDRGERTIEAPDEALPLHMYRELKQFGVGDEQISTLNPVSAARLIAEKYQES